jgi:hypothetical protein
MKFSPYVIDLLKQKSKKDFRLSGDCEYLALDIESGESQGQILFYESGGQVFDLFS